MEQKQQDAVSKTENLPYTKPQLTEFGDVRSLTASGSSGGAESGGSLMNMIMV